MISFVLDENNLLTRDTLLVTLSKSVSNSSKNVCSKRVVGLSAFWLSFERGSTLNCFFTVCGAGWDGGGAREGVFLLLIFLQKLGSCLSDQDKICQVHNSCNYYQPI